MHQFYEPLEPHTTYHIYSRATGNEKLFISSENYQFFLDKFDLYLKPIANLYVSSLLPKEFHFLLHIKSEEDISQHFKVIKHGAVLEETHLSKFIMKCFSNFLNSYAKSFNKYYGRQGSLFIDYFRRSPICKENYKNVIRYIHQTPLHQNLVHNIKDWPWSSFNDLQDISLRQIIVSSFGDYEGFLITITNIHLKKIHLMSKRD